MCLLLIHHRVREDWPVVLLANRDEAYDRPFDAPHRWSGPEGIVAPRDLKASGTWLGVNARGLVAAITNRPAPPGEDVRSRGLLVADVLRAPDADAASAWLTAHLREARYDPFNLVVLDRERACVLHFVGGPLGGSPAPQPIAPGVHVLTNLHDLDAAPVPPAGAPKAGERIEDLLARLERVAGDRDTPLPGDHRICRVGRTRGTVCSAVLALPADPRAPARLRFAPGPPHTTPFTNVVVGIRDPV